MCAAEYLVSCMFKPRSKLATKKNPSDDAFKLIGNDFFIERATMLGLKGEVHSDGTPQCLRL